MNSPGNRFRNAVARVSLLPPKPNFYDSGFVLHELSHRLTSHSPEFCKFADPEVLLKRGMNLPIGGSFKADRWMAAWMLDPPHCSVP